MSLTSSLCRTGRSLRPTGARARTGLALVTGLAAWAAMSPKALSAQYSLTAPSGEVVEFERDRLLAMRERSVALWDELQEDPLVLYYTSYGPELEADDRARSYPWNAAEVVTDSLAAVITPGNLREADRAYYNYIVLRMNAVRQDPDVPCDEVVARELEALDGFVDGWVVARTLFGGPSYEPLDEFAFAREAGVLPGMMADLEDRQLGGCLAVWREANPEAVAAYRDWRATRYEKTP